MGKWFSNTIAALVVLALTSLLGALLKAPIDGLANPNRLSAEVQLVPWVAKPALLDTKTDPQPVVLEGKTSEEIVEQLSFGQSALSDFGMARIIIENGSSNIVKNINIRLRSSYRDTAVVFVDTNRNVNIVGETDRVSLPDMAPGDQTTVFMWGTFSEYNIENYFRTFSSEGEFRLRYEWPEIRNFEYHSWIGSFLDEYAWTVFVVSSTLTLFGLLFGTAITTEYVRGIFVDDELRQKEIQKFLENPKKFQMDYTAGQSAWTAFQGRTKVADPPPKPDPENTESG